MFFFAFIEDFLVLINLKTVLFKWSWRHTNLFIIQNLSSKFWSMAVAGHDDRIFFTLGFNDKSITGSNINDLRRVFTGVHIFLSWSRSCLLHYFWTIFLLSIENLLQHTDLLDSDWDWAWNPPIFIIVKFSKKLPHITVGAVANKL